ncbi:substrate-binding domain-containing protein [Plantactinospora soyae]|uniref:substrate-binding domain-containing protein n=1 Tax=Plantactinospora soyae TaxID=1544732 RepID=UPI00298F2877|nr:substrate-binding domain-containing protein [Plantactinospora soyae]
MMILGDVRHGSRSLCRTRVHRFDAVTSRLLKGFDLKRSSMLTQERHDVILEELRRVGVVHVDRLAAKLEVSAVTVRRDLRELADRDLLRRVRGGGVLPAVPGAPARSTARPTGLVIGMVVPSLDYYYPQIMRAAQAAANAFGLRIAFRGSMYGSAASDQRQIERLLGDGVAGMLLTPSSPLSDREPLLDWVGALDMPVVLIERQPPSDNARWARLESVSTDHELGAALAVEHLTALGHRAIGLVVPRASPTSEPLRAGFLAAMRRVGSTRRRITEIDGDEVAMGGAGSARALDGCLGMGVSALLVHADRHAAALTQAARDAGIDVPGTLSVISYDDEMAGAFDPPLTAVRPPRSAIGQAAMELLVARLSPSQNRRPPCRMRLAPQLILRQSTARPARTPAR